MHKLWDIFGALIVTIIALVMLYNLLKPYAWLIAIGVAVSFAGVRIYTHMRRG